MEKFIEETLYSLVAEFEDGGPAQFVAPGDHVVLRLDLTHSGEAALSLESAGVIDPTHCLDLLAYVVNDRPSIAVPVGETVASLHGGDEPARCLQIALNLAGAIEDGQAIPVQVVLKGRDRSIGSNIVTMYARSRAALNGAARIEIVDDLPYLNVEIRNVGSASARDLRVQARVPEVQELHLDALPAGRVYEAQIPLRLSRALPNGTIDVPAVVIEAANAPTVRVRPEAIPWGRPLLQGKLLFDRERAYRLGEEVSFCLHVTNAGTGYSGALTMRLAPCAALAVVPGSFRVDGRITEPTDTNVLIGAVAPGASTIVEWASRLVPPLTSGAIEVDVAIECDAREEFRFREPVRIASGPQVRVLDSAQDRTTILPGEPVQIWLRLCNTGSRADQAKLLITGDVAKCEMLAAAGTPARSAQRRDGEWSFDLRAIATNEIVECQVSCVPRSDLETAAISLAFASLEYATDLRTIEVHCVHEAKIAARFEAVPERIHRDEQTSIRLHVSNVGNAAVTGIYVAASGDESLEFECNASQELQPGDSATIEVPTRLRQPLADSKPLPVLVTVGGANAVPVALPAAFITSYAVARFNGTISSDASAMMSSGDVVTFTLDMTSDGDGNAHRLLIRTEPMNTGEHVAGSVLVNGHRVGDPENASVLESPGLIFSRVPVGSRISISWQMRIRSRTGWLTPHVRATWNDGMSTIFAGEPIEVASTSRALAASNDVTFALKPAMPKSTPPEISATAAEAPPALPTGARHEQIRTVSQQPLPVTPPEQTNDKAVSPSDDVDRLKNAADTTPDAAKTAADGSADEPPAVEKQKLQEGADLVTQVRNEVAEHERVPIPPAAPSPEEPKPTPLAVVTYPLTADALHRVAQYLRACGGRGLLSHIIALGRLVATERGDGQYSAFEEFVESLKATIHSIFVRSNMRQFTIEMEDLQPTNLREAALTWLGTVGDACVSAEGVACLHAVIDSSIVKRYAEDIERDNTRALYEFIAHLVPTYGEPAELAACLAEYRSTFIDALRACPDEESFAAYISSARVERLDALLERIISLMPVKEAVA